MTLIGEEPNRIANERKRLFAAAEGECMKKIAILCIAILMCVSMSGCTFLRSMVPIMLDHLSAPKATNTPRYVQSTATPRVTPKPTQKPTPAPTTTPTATPTAEPEESKPQGIQFPIAP